MIDPDLRELRRAAVRRAWDTVDAAVRWATADSTSPQAAHGIDPSANTYLTPLATRVLTVRSKGGAAAMPSSAVHMADTAADRARIGAAIGQLEEVQQAILVWYAWGLGYRQLNVELRKHGRGMSNTRLLVLHRYARERMTRRLRDMGYLEGLDE
jgi:hypothetical protein